MMPLYSTICLFRYHNISHRLSSYVIRSQNLKTSTCLANESSSCSGNNQDGKPSKRIEKPDLKAAGANMNSSTGVIILMGLGLLCMYPLVFRPMLFSEELGEIQNRNMSKAGVNLASTRPSFMPEWTSPFDASAKPSNR